MQARIGHASQVKKMNEPAIPVILVQIARSRETGGGAARSLYWKLSRSARRFQKTNVQ